jgi:hypothetical protein
VHAGTGGSIYVNSSGTINGSQNYINRNFFVSDRTATNDVEVGWSAKNGGFSGPTVYAEWKIGTYDSEMQPYTGYSLNTDTNYHFSVVNVGGVDIWRFYVDGQSSPFNYSPTMPFNYNWSVTNSERHNSCDSLWTHMFGLQYYAAGTGSWTPFSDMNCWANSSGNNPYYLHEISNSELEVTTTSSGSLC